MPSNSLQQAQQQLAAFFKTPASQLMGEDRIGAFLKDEKNTLFYEAHPKTFHLEDEMQPTITFDPATFTMRKAMSAIAKARLHDGFAFEKSRNKARKLSQDGFQELIERSDWGAENYISANKQKLHKPYTKYLALMDGLAALADEGKAIKPSVLRDGVAVLDTLIKAEIVSSAQFSQAAISPEELQDSFYYSKAAQMIFEARLSAQSLKPEHMPEEIFKEAKTLRDKKGDEASTLRKKLTEALAAYLEKNLSMEAADYKDRHDGLVSLSKSNGAKEILTSLRDQVVSIAQTLGIPLGSRNRE